MPVTATSRRWRRLIANAGFLRRFRSLHGPLVAGDYYNGDYRDEEEGRISRHEPWFVPSSSIDARHFSLDFVLGTSIFPHRSTWDNSKSWEVLDSRGSLLLMECIYDTDDSRAFPDYVVCEPLTQRYKIIHQPPDDGDHPGFHGPYLIDGDEDEAGGHIGMSNFRVLCVFLGRDEAVYTTMFTACGETDATWSEKAIDHITSSRLARSCCLGRVLGVCYFYLEQDGKLITLDGRTGRFSLSVLPQDMKNYCDDARILTQNFAIVDGGDGEPRIVNMKDHTLEVFARVDGEWVLENKVLLPKVTCGHSGYQPYFNKTLTIMVRGVGFAIISVWPRQEHWPISVDLKTMEVAPAAMGNREKISYQCEFPWPPVLQVCLDR